MPWDQTIFLYAGSAAATVKPEFLRTLRGPAVQQFSHHRDIETRGRVASVVETFRGCATDGFGRVVVVGDVRADGYQNSIGLALQALREAHEGYFLSRVKTVEFFLSPEGESGTQGLVEAILPALVTFRTPPYVKVYMPSSGTPTVGDESGLTAVIGALTLAGPSRMAEIGEGLSALRNAPESAFFLAHYGELSLPGLGDAARFLVERSILDETYSGQPERSSGSGVANRVESLLAAYEVGLGEPVLMSEFGFEYRRAKYRDGLLHPLMTTLLRYFPQEDSLLDALDRLTNQVGPNSETLGSLLGDLRNELISARSRMSTFEPQGLECLGPNLEQIVRSIVKPLIQQYGFGVWPLVSRRVRPLANAEGVDGLYEAYERCVISAADAFRDIVMTRLRTRQEMLKVTMRAAAARIPGRWRAVPKSFLLVPKGFTTDLRDELWPYEHRCGWVGLLQREIGA